MKKSVLIVFFVLLQASYSQWTKCDKYSVGGYINGLAISGNKIFAATDIGIFMSQDNADSWTKLNLGIPEKFSVSSVTAKGNLI